MEDYKKILVALDLDEDDSSVIKFASSVSKLAGSEEVHFYHVADELDIPEKLCSEILEGSGTCDTIMAHMEDVVKADWEGSDSTKLSYEASDGDVLKDLLAYIKNKDIDLVMVQKTCGGSKIPERLARKAPCSVIMVPPGAEPTFKKIFVAVDFSDFSMKALERAISYATAAGADTVNCIHVYAVPTGYHKTGRTLEQFSEILKNNAIENFEKITGKMDLKGIKTDFIIEMNARPFQGIADLVSKNGGDLLVVGSRGRSKTSAILLGSVTERLIEVCNVPIHAYKRKGQGLSFIEAMFDI